MTGADEPLHPNPECTFRVATKNDLDNITQVHKVGFVVEPEAHYRYPLRNEYPEDYFNWTRKEYEYMLEQPEKYVLHVIDAPCEVDGEIAKKPVALAVWNIAVGIKAKFSDPGLDERRDANKAHCIAFRDVSGRRFHTYFKKYALKQINLSVLVVHPAFRRRKMGTTLVDWGIKGAEEKGWPVTLCASPMGRLLYEHLKFEVIGTEIVQIEGEEESMESSVMVRESKSGDKEGTVTVTT